jgi:5-hydroxyisourate hydrolase-like protein (transthyretin family)
MKKKALGIIILYLSMMLAFPMGKYIHEIQDNTVDDIQIVINNSQIKPEFRNMLNIMVETESSANSKLIFKTMDLTSPSYTNLSLSENDPIVEGTEATLTSQTTSAGHGVSSGLIDFKDLILNKIDDDPTSGEIYSNKFAIKLTLSQEITIEGFAIDITPTIREDINFYIRNTLAGANLRSGVISGNVASSAHTTDQMLYVPFSYCGGVSALTLTAGNSYYFILEPTISTSDTFFELHEASDIPNNVEVYEWYNNNFVVYHTDVNFYLIADEITIEDDVAVNGIGEAITTWNAFPQGNHALFSWYHGAVVYSESYGTCKRTVIPTTEILQVTLDPVVVQYKDITPIVATLIDEYSNPAVDKTVYFSVSSDEIIWTQIGTAISDAAGQVTLDYAFDLNPDNYYLKAYVNDLSFDTNSLLINPEILIFENIDFVGRYRNNPGMPTFTKLNAIALVKDDDDNPVPNIDLELWYKFDGEFEWIPHFFSTNTSGYADITHAVEDLLVGNHLETHYFKSASYEYGYQGNSNNGDSIVDKGFIDIILQDYSTKWNDNLQLSAEVLSLDEGWEGITIEFSYYDNIQWHSLGVSITNSTGFADLLWTQVPLTIGNYLLRAHAFESQYFEEQQEEGNLIVDRQSLNLYIIKLGEMKGNGEEIDLEYTSTMFLTFYVTFEDGTPVANIALNIVGRPINELFFNDLGYTTTNASGYALFNNYENVTIIGNQYLCVAQIDQNNKHESADLYFKLNLIRCTPIVYFEDHLCEKGTSTELLVFVMNSEGLPLYNVHVQFIIEGINYYGVSDCYGFIRVIISPEFSVGRYPIICRVIEDYRYNEVEVSADLVMSKGMPQFTLFDAYVIIDGYLTISAQAVDFLGRPIAGLVVLISFMGWSEYFTTNEEGYIEYTFQISGFEVGEYLSILTFNGNNDWYDAMATATVLIYEEESQLELQTTSISCIYGDEINLEAQLLTLDGLPLENRLIVFILVYSNGTSILIGQNTTDIAGFASLRVSIIYKPGSYDLFARYLGAVDYGPSYSLTSFIIQKSQVILLGNDFSAIINSTTTISVSIVNTWSQPVLYEKLYLYIWIDDNWLALGCFISDQNGIVDITLVIPFSLGTYLLKIKFKGNDYYNSNFLNLDMIVVEPPPRILPNLSVNTNSTIFADHEEILFSIYVSNAA